MQEDIGFVLGISSIGEHSLLLDVFFRKGGRIVGISNSVTAVFHRAMKGSLIEAKLYSTLSNNSKLSKLYIQNSKSISGLSEYSYCFQVALEMLDIVLVQRMEVSLLWACVQWIYRCINDSAITFDNMMKLHVIFEIELMNFLGEVDVFDLISEKLVLEYQSVSSCNYGLLNSHSVYFTTLSKEDYVAVTSFTDTVLQRYDKSVKNIRKSLILMKESVKKLIDT